MKRTAIRKKTCKCGNPKCYPSLGFSGWNFKCAPEEIKEKVGTKTQLARKKKNARLSAALKIRKDAAIENKSSELELFFHLAAIELANKPYCAECNQFIPSAYYRAATAHILPKKKEYGFPSVAAHPKNKLFLGAGCGCHNKTHRWDTFAKMKVWPLAVEAFKEIYPYIAENEKKNIPQVLLNTLDTSITQVSQTENTKD